MTVNNLMVLKRNVKKIFNECKVTIKPTKIATLEIEFSFSWNSSTVPQQQSRASPRSATWPWASVTISEFSQTLAHLDPVPVTDKVKRHVRRTGTVTPYPPKDTLLKNTHNPNVRAVRFSSKFYLLWFRLFPILTKYTPQ